MMITNFIFLVNKISNRWASYISWSIIFVFSTHQFISRVLDDVSYQI